jgi:hypothetical protein
MRCRPPGVSSIVEPASISMVEGEADPPPRHAARVASDGRGAEAERHPGQGGASDARERRSRDEGSASGRARHQHLQGDRARAHRCTHVAGRSRHPGGGASVHSRFARARARAELGAAEAAANDGDPSGYTHANCRLHEALEAPASSTLLGLIGDTWDRLWRSRRQMALFSLMPQRISNVQCEHYEILDALVRGEASRAAEAMTRHRDSTLAAWQAALAGIEERVSAEQS